MNQIVDTVIGLLNMAGAERYGMEQVSQLAHALQCASLAEQEGAGQQLVAAALLHDIGHLVGKGDEGMAERGVDRRHEDIAAGWLSRWFDDAVVEPVRLHVAAKRYLCRSDPGYFAHLSLASVTSLNVQGGIFDEADAAEFINRPFAEDAARLRRWDDNAKDPAMITPGLEHFRRHLEAGLKGG